MRTALFIVRKDLLYMLRERETLLWVFVMPFLFFYFLGATTGGTRREAGTGGVPLTLEAPENGGFLIDELTRRLEKSGFEVVRSPGGGPGEPPKRRLVVPLPKEGTGSFTERVLAGHQAVLTFHHRGDSPLSLRDRVRAQRAVYTVLADLVVLEHEQAPPLTAESFRRLAEWPRVLTLKVTPAGRRKHIPGGFEQSIPGTLVMFVLMVMLMSGAMTIVIERELGLLRRLASTPIPRSAVVAGKWAARLALGLVQVAFAMLVGSLLFGMPWGTALPMVVAVLAAWVACCASLGLVLANVARSRAQMAGLGIMTTMVLAALGGCWWPIEITPPWMQQLALLLPTGWTMDALHKLVSFGEPAASALPHVLGLVATTAVLGRLAVRNFRYE